MARTELPATVLRPGHSQQKPMLAWHPIPSKDRLSLAEIPWEDGRNHTKLRVLPCSWHHLPHPTSMATSLSLMAVSLSLSNFLGLSWVAPFVLQLMVMVALAAVCSELFTKPAC